MSEPKSIKFHVAMEHYKKHAAEIVAQVYPPDLSLLRRENLIAPDFFRIPLKLDPTMPRDEIRLVTSTEIVPIRNIGEDSNGQD